MAKLIRNPDKMPGINKGKVTFEELGSSKVISDKYRKKVEFLQIGEEEILVQGELDLDFTGKDEPVYEVTLKNVFPTTMNSITLNNEGPLVELNVQLSYDDWSSAFVQQAGQGRDLGAALIGGLAARLLN